MKGNYMEKNEKREIASIGILITSVSNFGEKGLYNSQEIGLAKALSTHFEKVLIFKLVDKNCNVKRENVPGYPGVLIKYIPAVNFGINGIVKMRELDNAMVALIHFSDTQLSVPAVYKWCKKNEVKYIPYIGVLESHSNNIIKRIITNTFFINNLQIYKKCQCCVKTPDVANKLKTKGVDTISLTPVGLDTDLLNQKYLYSDVANIKSKYGYDKRNRILLFVGRLTEEKQPEKMIDIFSDIYMQNPDYRLLMIGNGKLKEKIRDKIVKRNIDHAVRLIESVPNKDMWELYRIADCFVNLNSQEIFGMAILEAMYYECNVIAWDAPGPRYIIEDGVSGKVVNNDETIKEVILSDKRFGKVAHERIEEKFTWTGMAKKICDILSEG